jgi:hypothetical protein
MKVENIPFELTVIYPALTGGYQYPAGYDDLFCKEYPINEDRTSDSVLLESFLSLQIKN